MGSLSPGVYGSTASAEMLFSKHSEIPGRYELWDRVIGDSLAQCRWVSPSRAGFVASWNSSLSAQTGEHITGLSGAWWGSTDEGRTGEEQPGNSSLEASFLHANALHSKPPSPLPSFFDVVFSFCLLPCLAFLPPHDSP